MATILSTTELRKMSAEDLQKEITSRRAHLAKQKLSIGLQSEKDTGRFRREKRELARMLTVMNEMEKNSAKELNKEQKDATIPAPNLRRRKDAASS
jgi:ribosomal protein L29